METKEKKKFLLLRIIFKIIKFVFLSLFPGVKFIAMNKTIKKGKFSEDPWIRRQLWRNRIISLILTLPLFIATASTVKILSKDRALKIGYERTVRLAKKMEISKAYKEISKVLNYRDTKRRIEVSSKLMGYCFLFSFFFGWVFIYFHPIINETKKLTKILIQNSIIEEKGNLVLATPIGFLVKITGNTSAENILKNDAIWRLMNSKVGDFIEDSRDRSIVFFLKHYELKKEYLYTYDQ